MSWQQLLLLHPDSCHSGSPESGLFLTVKHLFSLKSISSHRKASFLTENLRKGSLCQQALPVCSGRPVYPSEPGAQCFVEFVPAWQRPPPPTPLSPDLPFRIGATEMAREGRPADAAATRLRFAPTPPDRPLALVETIDWRGGKWTPGSTARLRFGLPLFDSDKAAGSDCSEV